MSESDNRYKGFASPPCSMHELDAGWAAVPDRVADVAHWRKAERKRLIAVRLASPLRIRRQNDARLLELLAAHLSECGKATVALYWPIRGEPDLRSLFDTLTSHGACCALPVVISRGDALAFRTWSPGQPLTRGVWNIPIPEESAEIVVPDIVVAPVVGYDRAGFRLGYGGGYYDRTLAALPNKPHVIGAGYSVAAMQTIYPQPHDVPMNIVVTEVGLFDPAANSESWSSA